MLCSEEGCNLTYVILKAASFYDDVASCTTKNGEPDDCVVLL